METREDLLMKIKQYKFSINDLSLYLDTHPNDINALKLHNEYVITLKKLEEEYQEKFGPLTIETQMDTWLWVKDKWPWERGQY